MPYETLLRSSSPRREKTLAFFFPAVGIFDQLNGKKSETSNPWGLSLGNGRRSKSGLSSSSSASVSVATLAGIPGGKMAYSTGTTNRVSPVELNKPQTMTVANGRCTSDPRPVAKDAAAGQAGHQATPDGLQFQEKTTNRPATSKRTDRWPCLPCFTPPIGSVACGKRPASGSSKRRRTACQERTSGQRGIEDTRWGPIRRPAAMWLVDPIGRPAGPRPMRGWWPSCRSADARFVLHVRQDNRVQRHGQRLAAISTRAAMQ